MTFRPIKGTDDILPPDSRRWRRLFRVWEDLTERYGYELALTPIFESTDVFTRAVGESTDVVQKQMYTWEDKGGRSLTLRPEATAGVVRAFLDSGRQTALKVAYAGPMFRYEQPQALRRRQFVQLGVEYLGEPAPEADVEVIEIGYRLYEAVDVAPVEIRVNSLGDEASRATYRATLLEYLQDRQDELDDDCRQRMHSNPLRVLDCKVDGPKLTDAPKTVDALTEASADHYARVKAGLDAAGITYVEDHRLVRGLDYYTETVFEYIAVDSEVALDSLGGGGRYDGLAEQLGGRHLPAVGLSLGADRTVAHMADDSSAPLDVFVVAVSADRRDQAAAVVRSLRASGLRADWLLRSASVKAQFKAADRSEARFAAVIGDEVEDGKVTLRRLGDGHEELVDLEELAGRLHDQAT